MWLGSGFLDGTVQQWVKQPNSALWTARHKFGFTVVSSTIVLMGGLGSDVVYYNDVYKSTNNGALWTVCTTVANWPKRCKFPAVTFQSTIYIFGGEGSLSLYGDLLKSTDLGATWTAVAATSIMRGGHSAVITSNGLGVVLTGGIDSSKVIYNDVSVSAHISCASSLGYLYTINSCTCSGGYYGSPLNLNGALSDCNKCSIPGSGYYVSSACYGKSNTVTNLCTLPVSGTSFVR